MIGAVRDAVSHADGWIDDVSFFSNVAVAIRATIASPLAESFGTDLADIGLHFDQQQLKNLCDAGQLPAQELSCMLQITFFHDEPDLRRHVPSVPG